MKKKGFTLIELMGVIIILGVIILIATPAIRKLTSNSKEELYNIQISNIKDGLKNWAVDNSRILPQDEGDNITITLGQLKTGGYVDIELKNPKTNKCFGNDMTLEIKRYQKNYIYTVNENTGTETDICDDYNKPYLVLNGDAITYLELNDIYFDEGVTVKDAMGNIINADVTTTITGSGTTVDTSVLGNKYIITYSASINGEVISINRNVIVKDNTAPIILVPGDVAFDDLTKSFDVMDGVSATDNSGEAITVKAKSNITFGIIGKYKITYTATDSSGNTSTIVRIVTILKNEQPTIALNGNATTYAEVNSTYKDLGAHAEDVYGNDITKNITTAITGSGTTVDTSVLGNNYNITYSIVVKGQVREYSASVTRNVIVNDTIAPVITAADTTINDTVTSFDAMAGVSATDNSGETITVSASSNISLGLPGVYTITYTATDSSGNTATKTRKITIKDTTAPVITIPANATINDTATSFDVMAGVSAKDNSGENIQVKASHSIVIGKPGVYTITYTATDSSGNKATKTRTLTIKDTTPPTCSLQANADNTITFASKSSDATSYGISTSASASYGGNTSLAISVGTIYGYVRDAAGNTGRCIITITSKIIGCSSGWNYSGGTCYKYVGTATKTIGGACYCKGTGNVAAAVGVCTINKTCDCPSGTEVSSNNCTVTTSCSSGTPSGDYCYRYDSSQLTYTCNDGYTNVDNNNNGYCYQ